MEYQKIANLLDGESNQPSKFRRKNWVEINDESRGKQQWENIAYVIIVMHISLLKEK